MEVWICDDNEASAQSLTKLITAQETETETRIFTSPELLENALAMADELPQALFLDIVFPEPLLETLSLAAAERIHSTYPHLPIVFVTAFLEYAPEIFEAAPVYLLQKPFAAAKVAAALRAVHDRTAREAHEVLVIRQKGSLVRLPFAQIQYIESDRRKLLIHTEDQIYSQYGKLSSLLDQLPDSFAQCHQSYIVNLHQVSRLTLDSVILLSGGRLPVSRRRHRSFQAAVDVFMAHPTFAEDL